MRLRLFFSVLCCLLTELVCIQVNVPETKRSTMLFASVTLRCDYSTSANLQQVLVTWKYKSFCMDPVLDYYSTAYQAALQLGQNPTDNCPDNQRTVRVVAQKSGTSDAVLGSEYTQRKITIQNSANLVISEIMWWDNGMYFCSIDAPGDTTGDSDKEIQLIVYNWLTALLIIIGALMLIILLCICCCQCCPQKCCCYIRCPCCPQTCCCPEKAVMQHRMIKEAQKAMQPWLGGQPIYAPMSNHSQMNPLLYSGSVSGKNIPMGPMPLPPPHSMAYNMQPPGPPGHQSPAGTNHMLDFLENQVRGMDMTSPLLQPQQPGGPQQFHPQQMQMQMQGPPPPPHMIHSIPFSPGPPSMLSALDDHHDPAARRVITLPPIIDQPMGRGPPQPPRTRPPSSSGSSRSGYTRRRDDRGGSGGGGRRYPSPPRSRGVPRSYSEESLDGHHRSGPRSITGMDRPRSRSRDDIFDSRSRGNYSPPASRRSKRGSWSSDDESVNRRGGGGGGGRKNEKPPSYTEYEPGQKPLRRSDRYSDKSSRSGTSVVI